jgi:hypothetical protein
MIGDLWGSMTSQRCRKLVDSMPRRIEQCVLARGGTFSKYYLELYEKRYEN